MRFTDTKFAQDYDSRMTREGYPGTLLDIIINECENYHKIIDIGAGSGHFAIPLARKGYLITAIEPSSPMATLFMNKIHGDEIEKRITIEQCRWEDWWGQSHDVALCAYAIYGMENIKEAIRKMLTFSKKTLILIGNESTSTTLSGIIRKSLGLSSCARDIEKIIHTTLEELNANFEVKNITQIRQTIFSNLNEEVEYFLRHLGLNKNYKKKIKQILIDSCYRSDPKVIHIKSKKGSDPMYTPNQNQIDSDARPGSDPMYTPNQIDSDARPGSDPHFMPQYTYDNIYHDLLFVVKSSKI